MIFGYARVSTKDQILDLQIDALRNAGCEKIYTEKVSGYTKDRQELNKLLDNIRAGDIIIIYKLDRLGRSLKHLLELIQVIQEKKVELKSIHDAIDTSNPTGKLIFSIFASLSEFERDLIRERTLSGLASARARGRIGGKPKGLSKEADAKANTAVTLYQSNNHSIKEIMEQLNISKQTLYNYLRIKGVTIGSYEKISS
jgi:DNA invertase Pin-like site-specific DNA recombinase